MSEPVLQTTVVARAQSRLTGAYAKQPNVRAWCAAMAQPWQDLENAAFGLYLGLRLGSAPTYALPQTNAAFDVLGAIVGQARLGLSDADYQTMIYLRIAANRSNARAIDFSTMAQILVARTGAGPVQYFEGAAEFDLGVWNMALNPNLVASLLAQAAGNAIGGTFAYSTWPDGDDCEFDDVAGASVSQAGLGDTADTTAGGLLVSGVAI